MARVVHAPPLVRGFTRLTSMREQLPMTPRQLCEKRSVTEATKVHGEARGDQLGGMGTEPLPARNGFERLACHTWHFGQAPAAK